MKTDELQEKANTFFKENKISELPQDPTTSYQKIVKNTINQCTHTQYRMQKNHTLSKSNPLHPNSTPYQKSTKKKYPSDP